MSEKRKDYTRNLNIKSFRRDYNNVTNKSTSEIIGFTILALSNIIAFIMAVIALVAYESLKNDIKICNCTNVN